MLNLSYLFYFSKCSYKHRKKMIQSLLPSIKFFILLILRTIQQQPLVQNILSRCHWPRYTIRLLCIPTGSTSCHLPYISGECLCIRARSHVVVLVIQGAKLARYMVEMQGNVTCGWGCEIGKDGKSLFLFSRLSVFRRAWRLELVRRPWESTTQLAECRAGGSLKLLG